MMMQAQPLQVADDTQEFVILLSLDSLQTVWPHMHMDVAAHDAVMRAARQVIIRMKPDRWGPRAEVSDAFLQTLADFCSPDEVQAMRRWFSTIDGRPNDQSLRLWSMWLSANQHKLSFPQLDTPLTLRMLGAYRKDVVQATKALETELVEKVRLLKLSDWDVFIHTEHRICYFAQGRFDNSLAFLVLLSEKQNRLMAKFLRDWAVILPASYRQELRDMIWHDSAAYVDRAALAGGTPKDARNDVGPVLAMESH
ncbi:MAG: hypothetical protein RLZZ437_3293 [Pseudomonadota bacterium]|jgi:hypothetical protein